MSTLQERNHSAFRKLRVQAPSRGSESPTLGNSSRLSAFLSDPGGLREFWVRGDSARGAFLAVLGGSYAVLGSQVAWKASALTLVPSGTLLLRHGQEWKLVSPHPLGGGVKAHSAVANGGSVTFSRVCVPGAWGGEHREQETSFTRTAGDAEQEPRPALRTGHLGPGKSKDRNQLSEFP